MQKPPGVTLALSRDQALVLFDWLTGDGHEQAMPNARAASLVLLDIEAQLERTLVEPLQADYEAAVAGARARLEADGNEDL